MNKKNKKGFIAGILVDFYAYLAFALIILIFFVLFAFAKSNYSKGVTYAIEDTSTSTYLDNYLKTPVNPATPNRNIADLITYYYIEKYIHKDEARAATSFETLNTRTKEILGKFPEIKQVILYFQIDPASVDTLILYEGPIQSKYGSIQQKIPVPGNQSYYITILMMKGITTT